MTVLQVGMFGGLTLTYGSATLQTQSGRSRKLRMLLEYFLVHRQREISQQEVIELLWPEDERANPQNTLKTLLYRLREQLESLGIPDARDLIRFSHDSYVWDKDFPVEVDTDHFETLLREPCESANERLLHLLDALALYVGDFLPKSQTEPWAVALNTYYHALYLKSCHEAVSLLLARDRTFDVIELCKRGVAIDPYDEALHTELIRALAHTGQRQAALHHYSYVTDLFFKQFGATPSAALTDLYKDIVRETRAVEMDLSVIRARLGRNLDAEGAFFCELAMFEEIYRVNVRSAARNGQAAYLCLLTLLPTSPLTTERMGTVMDKLRDVVREALRRGDIFCRYSASQFLLLLPGASFENSRMVTDRIVSAFRKRFSSLHATLDTRLLPMEAML